MAKAYAGCQTQQSLNHTAEFLAGCYLLETCVHTAGQCVTHSRHQGLSAGSGLKNEGAVKNSLV